MSSGLDLLITLSQLPVIILVVIGLAIRKSHPKRSKVFFILAGVYQVIGFGVCASMMLI